MNACFYMSDCYVTKLAGILQVSAYLFLQFIALTLELSFVDFLTDPIINPDGAATNPPTARAFSSNRTYNAWSIRNSQAKCDIEGSACLFDNICRRNDCLENNKH